MNRKTDADLVINALKKVPEKRLLIIEMVNRIPLKGGDLNPEKLLELEPEVNLAVAEATAYGNHTIMAVNALSRVKAVPAPPPVSTPPGVGPSLEQTYRPRAQIPKNVVELSLEQAKEHAAFLAEKLKLLPPEQWESFLDFAVSPRIRTSAELNSLKAEARRLAAGC